MSITLSEALASGRLQEFAAQAEADGVGPADHSQFDAMVGRVTAPLTRRSNIPFTRPRFVAWKVNSSR